MNPILVGAVVFAALKIAGAPDLFAVGVAVVSVVWECLRGALNSNNEKKSRWLKQ